MALHQHGNGARQEILGQRRHAGDGELAALQGGGSAQLLDHDVDAGDQLLGTAEEPLALGGQADAAGGAVEERHAEPLLELAHMGAERRGRDVQQQVFIKQMELARGAKLPIVIHCRPSEGSEDAWEDCLGLVEAQWAAKGLSGILHCFTGNWGQAKRALDVGFMISFAGNLTFPKAQQIRDAALEVPLERMLIETDSPYLAPVPYRGKRNEPAFVKETARKMGELRGLSMEEVGERTSRNFYNFFKLAEISESKVPAR